MQLLFANKIKKKPRGLVGAKAGWVEFVAALVIGSSLAGFALLRYPGITRTCR
jgi:hypothetical protein